METVVFSLGGSLIYPDGVDVSFLKRVKDFILELTEEGYRIVIVTGGGAICREYNNAAKSLANPGDSDLDWMGIAATKLNAELVRIMFGEEAYENIVKDPATVVETDKSIIVASGYKPGNSSDKMAVMLAEKFKAGSVISMTNVDRVYDSDPKENPQAEELKEVTWNELLQITGEEWEPGKNVPFDPAASKLAKKNDLKVVILNGQKLDNLNNYFLGREFTGTVIRG